MDVALTNPPATSTATAISKATGRSEMKASGKDICPLAGYPLLANCLDPPTPDAVLSAETFLTAIGALDAHRKITPLGKHLSCLPCDPSVGKMLIYGAMLQCVAPVATIASLLVSRDPFVSSQDVEMRQRVDSAKKRYRNIQ
jgi:HrpA-like RNA helicase